jgi:tagatose 1,6-diphosphate aldolase
MKVEVPINMKYVEGAKSSGGQTAYSRQEAMDHFRKSADVSTKPFIYLSAGVSNPEFSETLELAGEAGTRFSGVLCGRATWANGVAIYGKQGGTAFRTWLEDQGVANIQNVNERLKAAHPWYEFYGAKSADELG